MPRIPALALLTVAATSVSAQSRLPVRPLGPVVARSGETFGGAAISVRALPGGRVLVNDLQRRRVLMLDSALASPTVVADTTPATGTAYGGRLASLIPYRGDSTLFVDAQTMSMLVIDPAGKIGRTMSVPRSQDAMALVSGAFGVPGFDPRGRLVYRAAPDFRMQRPMTAGGAPGAMQMPQMPQMPDSAAIVRVDLATRVLDTVGYVKVPKITMSMTQDANGRTTMQSIFNPLPLVDDWAVLNDGTVAFLRGRDYRMELVAPDGTKQSPAKLPFDWQRLTDEQKSTFMDSVKAQRARMGAVGGADMGGGGGMRIVMQMDGPGGGSPPPRGERRGPDVQLNTGGPGAGGPGAAGGMTPPPLQFIDPSELPDYRPPFFANSTRVDPAGNLWIRTTATPTQAGALVYDVVTPKGELTDRVQVPSGRTVVGFAKDGSVYLSSREGTGPTAVTLLERARVR